MSALVVAIVALIAGLGGAAVAGKGGKVKTKDVNLVKHKSKSAPTSSIGGAVKSGPGIGGKAKKGDLLRISARATIVKNEGGAPCFVFLAMKGSAVGIEQAQVMSSSSPAATTLFIGPANSGVEQGVEAVERTVPIAKNGRYKVSLKSQAGHATSSCTYSDRKLWVEQIR